MKAPIVEIIAPGETNATYAAELCKVVARVLLRHKECGVALGLLEIDGAVRQAVFCDDAVFMASKMRPAPKAL